MNDDNRNIIAEPKKAIVTNQISKNNNSLAITSLVLGIISLILCWGFIIPIILGIIGIVTGTVSLGQKRDGSKIAIAGIILSIVGLLIGIVFSILCVIGILISY